MQKRTLEKFPTKLKFINERKDTNYHTIEGNYFPVDSAIVMRDTNSNKQVTVMNDRAQGGSADLTDKATIELMQNRRLLRDDGKGPNDLNETESIYTDSGLIVTAKYKIQIFDLKKGQSQQREQQVHLQEPL
jgi:hypothetical protein